MSSAEFENELQKLNDRLEADPEQRKNLATRITTWFTRAVDYKKLHAKAPSQRTGLSRAHEGMIDPGVEWRAQDEASIRACPRDHDRERIKSPTGRMWMCPDICGWCERVIETVELES